MSWIEPPGDFDPHSMAEFIESELLISDDDYLSLSEIRGLFPIGNQPTDDEIVFGFAEIERRMEQWASKYPYLVDDRGVMIDRGVSGSLYFFLLLMSLKGTPTRVRGEYPRSDRIFDAVSREAFAAERGPKARAVVFAWPPRDGRPAKFDQAVEWLAGEMGIATRGVAIPDFLQDGGVDIVVWRPFPDTRRGFQITLVQNTVQWSFSKKPHDVRPKEWFVWLDVGVEPSVGFAVPFSIPSGDIWWERVTQGTSVVLDRGRLMHILAQSDPQEWPEWAELTTFVAQEIEDIRSWGLPAGNPAVGVPKPRRKEKALQSSRAD